MKKTIRSVLISILMILLCSTVLEHSGLLPVQTVEAHSGRTDSSGGHHDYKNKSGLGSYHYHCGGHPAHLHPNGVCPYSQSTSGSRPSSNKPAPVPVISRKKAALYAGDTLTLKVSNSSAKVKWSSSKSSVATVNAKGKVSAKKKGTAVITALAGSKKLTCRVTVKALALNKKKITLTEGSSATLKIKGASRKIKWTTSDKKIATVTSSGRVKAKRAGTATITARIMNKDYKCRVTVKKRIIPVEDFWINTYSLELKEGHTVKVPFTIEPSNATDRRIIWTSSNPDVASVSQGVITGISCGNATITASCGGYKDSCEVTVRQDFVSADARNAIKYTAYTGECGMIAEVTSTYKYPMSLEAKCAFYDQNGTLLQTSYDTLDCLEPGQTLCMLFSIPYSFSGEAAYDSCQISFTPDQCSCGSSRFITCTETRSADRLNVSVSNNGSEFVNLVRISVIFYRNGQALSFESLFADCYAPQSLSSLYFKYPCDNDGNIIVPDNYKLFIESNTYESY